MTIPCGDTMTIPVEEKNIPRRLLLYVHYDRDGQVDPHVVYQLKSLYDFGMFIIFISNSAICDSDAKIISPFVIDIRQRNNIGYDMTAWKDAIISLESESLVYYDELIIMNDSCYGPIFPLDELFSKMDEKKVDFWGITRNIEPQYPEHIHSYFVVFRKNIFHSESFFEFWNTLKPIYTYSDAINNGELRLTKYFTDLGYQYAVYADIPLMLSTPETGVEYPLVFSIIDWLVRKYHTPFIKIKAFWTRFGKQFNIGREFFVTLNEYSSYPIQLIIDHLRRTRPLSWHKNLPDTLNVIDVETPVLPDPGLKIAVFAHFFYEDQVKEGIAWLCNIPYFFDLYVSTSSQEKAEYINTVIKGEDSLKVRRVEIRVLEDRGRDVAAWLLGFKDVQAKYDVALKFHLKKRPEPNPVFAWEWNHFLMQSMLASPGYVANVIHMFEKYEKLGLVFHIFPPMLTLLLHQQDSIKETMKWKNEILQRLHIDAPNETSWSIYSNNIFWYRPKSLYTLFYSDITIDEFPVEPFPDDGTIAHGMERAIPYIAHGSGYSYKLVIPSHILPSIFQHYEDHILNLEAYGYIRPIQNKKIEKKYYFYDKYCVCKPWKIPIGRAFQIAFLSLYGHIMKYIGGTK